MAGQQETRVKDDAGSGDDGKAKSKEPPGMKLRSSDPDLKVTIRFTKDDQPAEKCYEMFSQAFALKSKVVDTMLSVDMKEKETREIVLHDVTPEIWEGALRYLDDPSAVLDMTISDAMEVVEFYDRYQFEAGVKLCDRVVSQYINQAEQTKGRPDDLDLLVDVIVLAESHDLKKVKESGKRYLFSTFSGSRGNCFGPEMFSEEHIRKLQPFLVKENAHEVFYSPVSVSKEELQSALFPKYFVEAAGHRYMQGIVTGIMVSGSNCKADGTYRRAYGRRFECESLPYGGLVKFYMDRCPLGDWTIRYELADRPSNDDDEIMWKCPNSQNLECPPTEPWIPVCPEASYYDNANLIITYITR